MASLNPKLSNYLRRTARSPCLISEIPNGRNILLSARAPGIYSGRGLSQPSLPSPQDGQVVEFRLVYKRFLPWNDWRTRSSWSTPPYMATTSGLAGRQQTNSPPGSLQLDGTDAFWTGHSPVFGPGSCFCQRPCLKWTVTFTGTQRKYGGNEQRLDAPKVECVDDNDISDGVDFDREKFVRPMAFSQHYLETSPL